MNVNVRSFERSQCFFIGADGNRLAADVFAPSGKPVGCVILLHGGGQTRHSWSRAGEALARDGWHVISLDLRGHGDSEWHAGGDYSMLAYGRDLESVVRQIAADRKCKPVVVGASLGGIAGMIAAGELAADVIRALVLVDITPEVRHDGVERILGFMAEKAETGFATLEEAADAIARYLPHRPRPRDSSGLAKNLRQGDDGRFRWHWDPRFLESRSRAREHADELRHTLVSHASQLTLPVLLVRGRESELVGDGEAMRFKQLVPHAQLADVSGARHMVAGDQNDVFLAAVRDFLSGLS